jgi:hypothetical protein
MNRWDQISLVLLGYGDGPVARRSRLYDAAMAEDDFDEPIADDERAELEQDLLDVQVLKELLGPRGLKGVVFFCPDCDEDHYLTWDLLAGNLQQLLQAGESPVHEPAFEPDPDEYVGWDYARGFLDGYETYEEEEAGELAGALALELKARGWPEDDIRSLLESVGIVAPEDG